MAIEKGDTISVHYTGTLKSGEKFDSSEGREPLKFTVGAGQMIKGFDSAVLGMDVNQEKVVTLEPAVAYGMPNPQLIREFDRSQFPPEQEPVVGAMLMVGTSQGQQFPAKIVGIEGDKIKIDLNHPLAGQSLIFKISIVSVEKPKQ